ncbi:MAG: PAS domain S-box protein [Methylovirgula sp.]
MSLAATAADATRFEDALHKTDATFITRWADAKDAFVEALVSFKPDIVLAQDAVPEFSGRQALSHVRQTHPDVPVIMVMTEIDEDTAIALSAAGAADYVLASTLLRLGFVVQRVIAETATVHACDAAEQALRQSQERFHTLVDSFDNYVWQVDAKAVYTYVSPGITKALGYRPDELIGKTPFDVMTAEEAKRLSAIFEPIMTAHRPFSSLENNVVHRDGHEVILESSGIPIFNDDGEFSGYYGIDRDITARKRAVLELGTSEFKLRSVLDAVVDGIIVADTHTHKFVLANDAICRMLGYSATELSALSVDDIHPAEALADVRRQFDEIHIGAHQTTHDQLVRRKDGTTFYAAVTASPMPIDGELYGVGIFHDLTDQKKSEAILRTSEERFRAIFDSVSDGIIVHDLANGAFIEANPRVCEMFGYTRDEFLKLDIGNLQIDESSEAREDDRARTMQALAGHLQIFERQVRAKDGHAFWVEIALRRSSFGGQDYLISTAHDITQRKQADEALIYRDRLLHAVTVSTAGLVSTDRLDVGMAEALKIVGEALDVDRVNVLSDQSAGAAVVALEYVWERPDIAVSIKHRDFHDFLVDLSGLDSWHAPLLEGKPVITHTQSAPLAIRKFFEHLQNKSTLLVPIFMEGVFWGNIGLDACRVDREWTATEIDVLKTFAEVIGIVVLRDKTRLSLQRSEEQFRAVSETAQDAIVMTDTAGRVQYWNPAAERMFGYTANEAAAKGGIEDWLVPRRFRPSAEQAIAEFAATGRSDMMGKAQEVGCVHADGHEIPVELSVAPVTLPGGCFSIALLHDITDRKTAEASLRNAAAQLTNALHMARAGDWVYNVAKDEFTFNDNFYHIFRTTAEEVGGYTMSSSDYAKRFCHPDDIALVGREVAAAINSTNPNFTHELEHRILYKNGEVGYIAVRIFVVKDKDGKTVKSYGVNQDITQRKRDEEVLRRLNRTLRTLSDADTAVVHATGEQELLDEMCRIIVQVGGYRLAWIGRRDEAKTVTPIAHAGEDAAYLEHIDVTWDDTERGQGPTGTAIRTGETQINHDFATNPALGLWRESAKAHGYSSSIALPLNDRSGTFAALTIYSMEQDTFDPEEVKLLTELAEDLSFGIAALRDRVGREAMLDRLQLGLEATVEALASTAELRDAYTAGHQRRVAEIACAIARRLGLSDSRIHGLRLAGIVHDIGKIQIPSEILSKPGKLTALEYELIKQHAQASYDVVKNIDFPWPVADIIIQHHERIDGSGYPKGLKGDQILLEGKILAVADVVEAMMSHRPYRAALGIDAALAEIARGKDKIYDPIVADACIALFREDGFTVAGPAH